MKNKIVSRFLKTNALFFLLCVYSYSQAQDTLLFLDFNRPGATTCPEGVNLDVSFIHFNYLGYLNSECSDTALTVLAESKGEDAMLFFEVVFDTSGVKIGDVLRFSFDVTSLNPQGVSSNTIYGHFIFGTADDFWGGGGRYLPYPYLPTDSIFNTLRIEGEQEIYDEYYDEVPHYFQSWFAIKDSYVFDNFLIVRDVRTGAVAGEEEKEAEVLFYYTLEGKQIATPQQGQFVIAMLSNGERRKMIFN